MQLNIKVDDKEVKRLLLNIDKTVKNMKSAMNDTGDFLLKRYDKTFKDEATVAGEKWKALAPSTVAQRIRLGYTGKHMILQRTKDMRNAFYKEVKKFSVKVANTDWKFPFHQLGGKAPKRQMIGLTDNMIGDIIEIINKFLRKKIKK